MKLTYWKNGTIERVYINRGGHNDRIFSVVCWVEPLRGSNARPDWKFEYIIKDAESDRRCRELKAEFRNFVKTELASFLSNVTPSFLIDYMEWSDWVEVSQRTKIHSS